jgi:hypothetical protein
LNALYSADVEATSSAPLSARGGFHEIMTARGKEIFQLATELDISRGVLADLFNGWMAAPIRRRLIDAVLSSLAITREAFDSALQFSLQNPRFGLAKADKAPTDTPAGRPTAPICSDCWRTSAPAGLTSSSFTRSTA